MDDLRSVVQQAHREDEEQRAQALAAKLGLPYVSLADYPFAPTVLQLVPAETRESLMVVPYLRTGPQLKLATPQPESPDLAAFLTEFGPANGYQLELAVCSVTSYRYALQQATLADHAAATHQATAAASAPDAVLAGFADKASLAERLMKISTTEVLDVLFAGAIAMRATDIHVEPGEREASIRFRIDGVLQEIVRLPVTHYRSLRSRIKYLAQMKLDVVATPQDGRFEFRSVNQKVDVRVSALPTPYGDTFVLRLLAGGGQSIKLEELGFSPEQVQIIREAASKPNGLILNTGPTGSGKTTTLYAIVQELNQPGRKIITIEDPIEYKIPGVQQTQVEPEAKYDFAGALRSSLRQDPDVMMVGEIRDPETATIAVQASLTGHLVISTLHTNSAPGAIPRLLDMGVKTYLLGGVINLIIAQRLVRKLAYPDKQGDERYEGRVAIAELLVPNEEIETLIQQKASIEQFEGAAKRAGMVSLWEDGMRKVQAGLTTEEEVRRVAVDLSDNPASPVGGATAPRPTP
ncbi:type II/IV secretion system protein [Candidatus Berkelbacteria bacterium]|nr:type II/IV secretion system protein [Candidatus Berkelbacteria bacterium]